MLGKGQFQAAQYLRLDEGGREVWIQASYTAIFDSDGKPYKVVKYATDISDTKSAFSALGVALQALAQGNLSARLDTAFPPELDPVRHAFNQSAHRFTEIVRGLRTTSSELRSATSEILAGLNDLSERSARQAAAIEQTSASIEQLNQTVTANAGRTDKARNNAHSVSQGAADAGVVMSETNLAMQNIAAQAAPTSSIIGLISDIAFQTNLLALNASVVAVKVRRVAQSAANASSEIKGLIEKSNQALGNGAKLVSMTTNSSTAS